MSLVYKVGSVGQDNLLARVLPPAEVTAVNLRKLSTETTLKRGTVLARSGTDGKAVILGTSATGDEVLTPAYILCDDTTVGTEGDAPAVVYRTGCFNRDAVIVAENYTLTANDEDALRKYGIVFSEMLKA